MSNINTHYLPDFEFFQIKIYKRNINFCEFFSLFSLLFNHVVEWPSQLLGSRLALRIIGLCKICLSVNSRWHQHRLCCCCWLRGGGGEECVSWALRHLPWPASSRPRAIYNLLQGGRHHKYMIQLWCSGAAAARLRDETCGRTGLCGKKQAEIIHRNSVLMFLSILFSLFKSCNSN